MDDGKLIELLKTDPDARSLLRGALDNNGKVSIRKGRFDDLVSAAMRLDETGVSRSSGVGMCSKPVLTVELTGKYDPAYLKSKIEQYD